MLLLYKNDVKNAEGDVKRNRQERERNLYVPGHKSDSR